MSLRRRAAAALMAALVWSADPLAQEAGSHDWHTWLEAVNTHVPGERDEAVQRIAPWSSIELDALLPELQRQFAPDQLRIVGRAVVLHADAAILNRDDRGYNLAAGTGGGTVFEDGRRVGQMSGTDHWDFARELIDGAPRGEERRQLGRRFYRATGAMLQLWGEYPELITHLAAGRRLLGDDAVLLLYEGTMRQAFAGPRVQRVFDDERREQAEQGPTATRTLPPMPGGPSVQIPELPPAPPSIRDSRSRAERLFRRALAIDPGLWEARIRLAHVLGDSGRHHEAAAALKPLPIGPLPPFLDYYAALIAARESRARGQLAAARAAFARAATIYPNAPAPRLGLSELAMAEGNPAESLAELVRSQEVAAVAPGTTEPWWWIDRMHAPSAQSLMSDLREAAAK
jgi:tetratricopeptide (TPR) repeat protein